MLLIILAIVPLLTAEQDCIPGDWSEWSNCDKNCGAIGTRERTR